MTDPKPCLPGCQPPYHSMMAHHAPGCPNAPAPVEKAGEVDWTAAEESSQSWAKGRPLQWDLKCTNAEETLGRAYLALRAELAAVVAEVDKRDDESSALCIALAAERAAREKAEVCFYRLWDLADATVGGGTSETGFVDGRKRILAAMISARQKEESRG